MPHERLFAGHSACHLRPTRVVFGAGALASMPDELARARLERPFIVATPGRRPLVDRLQQLIGGTPTGHFLDARLHVPADIVGAAVAAMTRARADCCVSLGGGSAIGLGKALARDTGVPLIAVPTTYSGSEMTDIWGVTDGGQKRTGRDPRVAPMVVIYDPQLTLTLPPDVSAASGMNGAAHAVEALYARDANPLASLVAAEALRRFARALPLIVHRPDDEQARHDALGAAHFAGLALSLTTMGLHHKLCHVLGGSFGLPHALTHAVLLPFVTAFNAEAAADAMHVLAAALDATDPGEALFALNRRLALPGSLRDLGLRAEDVDRAASLAVETPYPNPRPVTYDAVRALLRAAYAGRGR